MLDMGFAEDIEAILERRPAERQTVLFSATLPARINGLVQALPARSGEGARSTARTPAARRSGFARSPTSSRARTRPSALGRLLDIEAPAAAVVFCRTRDEVDTLAETLDRAAATAPRRCTAG